MELVKRKGHLNQKIEWELEKKCDDCERLLPDEYLDLEQWLRTVFGRRTEREYYGYVVRCHPCGFVFWHEASEVEGFMAGVVEKSEEQRRYIKEKHIYDTHIRIKSGATSTDEGSLNLYNAIRRGVLDPVKQKVARLGNEYLKYIDFNQKIQSYIVIERLGNGDEETIKCYRYLQKYLTLIPTVEIPQIPEPGDCPHHDIEGVTEYVKYCNNFVNTYQWAIYYSRALASHALIKKVNAVTQVLPGDSYSTNTIAAPEKSTWLKPEIETEHFKLYRGSMKVRGAYDKKTDEYNWVNPLSKKYAIKNTIINLDELYATVKKICTDLKFQNDDTEKIDILYDLIKSTDEPEVDEDELGEETPEGDACNPENNNK